MSDLDFDPSETIPGWDPDSRASAKAKEGALDALYEFCSRTMVLTGHTVEEVHVPRPLFLAILGAATHGRAMNADADEFTLYTPAGSVRVVRS